ncbi:MAG: hypothetical protein KF689_09260 [Gemmatimonadaceae bacterium]|nr:hypothetical protein [Gemmatimonadaceae bacterium]MCW5826215.1 hypothetical protein [Gemmatimonadaceae bacterium]
MPVSPRCISLAATVALLLAPIGLAAQGGGNPQMQEAMRLHEAGRHAEARRIYQQMIDAADSPRARAAAQRSMARSAGFDGDCALAVRYEEMVIAYHKTREASVPQDAFYQQGEMANEAARICADAGALDEAERMYRRGSELGNMQPEPRENPRVLWDFRLNHAMARLSALRGDAAAAQRYLTGARASLDAMVAVDSSLARQQERFFQYLPGYIALYTGQTALAVREMERATAIPGNDRDPQLRYLLGLAYERAGEADRAKAQYERALAMASGNNPPNSFARREAAKKLGK